MSIFDSVFCTILNSIENLPQDLSERYERLIVDDRFIELTTIGTTDEKVLKERFSYVKDFLTSIE
jgi:hypothetical protein